MIENHSLKYTLLKCSVVPEFLKVQLLPSEEEIIVPQLFLKTIKTHSFKRDAGVVISPLFLKVLKNLKLEIKILRNFHLKIKSDY